MRADALADPATSSRQRRRAGLERLAPLLDELRAFESLREGRPGDFRVGSRPFLHFHYLPGGQIVADIAITDGDITRMDVSGIGGQQELLSVVESCLGVA